MSAQQTRNAARAWHELSPLLPVFDKLLSGARDAAEHDVGQWSQFVGHIRTLGRAREIAGGAK